MKKILFCACGGILLTSSSYTVTNKIASIIGRRITTLHHIVQTYNKNMYGQGNRDKSRTFFYEQCKNNLCSLKEDFKNYHYTVQNTFYYLDNYGLNSNKVGQIYRIENVNEFIGDIKTIVSCMNPTLEFHDLDLNESRCLNMLDNMITGVDQFLRYYEETDINLDNVKTKDSTDNDD